MAAPYANMVAGPNDGKQQLLVKLVYWLEQASVVVSTGPLLPSMAPNAHDAQQELLVKAAYWAQQLAGGGNNPSSQLTNGVGLPPLDGSVKTLFYRDSTTGQKFINAGTIASPTWEAI